MRIEMEIYRRFSRICTSILILVHSSISVFLSKKKKKKKEAEYEHWVSQYVKLFTVKAYGGLRCHWLHYYTKRDRKKMGKKAITFSPFTGFSVDQYLFFSIFLFLPFFIFLDEWYCYQAMLSRLPWIISLLLNLDSKPIHNGKKKERKKISIHLAN